MIIKALKRLINELKNGYCECLTEEQLDKLMQGFESILQVEKEVANGFNSNRRTNRFMLWSNIFHNVFPFKKEGDKYQNRK